jgi:hypothetical protein
VACFASKDLTMFTADDLQARIRQRPFVPLRLVTATGQTYDIYHPDLVMIGRRDLMIGTASAEHPTQYEQVTRVAILHVTELRDLPVPVQPASGDGTA